MVSLIYSYECMLHSKEVDVEKLGKLGKPHDIVMDEPYPSQTFCRSKSQK